MSGEGDSPRKVHGLVGNVERGPFGTGSKSEREAVWIKTANVRLVLRRKGGPSYGDRELERYVGKHVKCDGFIVGYTLLAEHIETLP
jgi:hypothetical protein